MHGSKVFISYPDKFTEEMMKDEVLNIIKAIYIKLPNELYGKFEHRNYLGAVMSLGLTRERIGDIIVYDDCAYIIVLEENADYIKKNLEVEKMFRKAQISIVDINNIKVKPQEFEEITISVNSNRIDNIVSEMLNVSRKVAQELLEDEKVYLNYTIESKFTKTIKENDIFAIRGKGKFIVSEFIGKNKRGKDIILIKKYK